MATLSLFDRYNQIATGNSAFQARMQMALVQKAKAVHDDLVAWVAVNPNATPPTDKVDADALAAKAVKDLTRYASLFCINIAALLPDPADGTDLTQYPDDALLLQALDDYWPYAAIAAKMS